MLAIQAAAAIGQPPEVPIGRSTLINCSRAAVAASAASAAAAAAAPRAAAAHELQRLAPQQRPQLLQLHLVVPQAAACSGEPNRKYQSPAYNPCRA